MDSDDCLPLYSLGLRDGIMEPTIAFSGPLRTAFSGLVDTELRAYFTYENMEFYFARQSPDRRAFAEYFRQSKLAHRDRARDLMIMARKNAWPFRIRLEGLPEKNKNWGFARFAFTIPKEIERGILDATLLLSRRANQMRFGEIIKLTDEILEDQNRALADINLNLARLTRCNSSENENIFNDYLAYIIATAPPRYTPQGTEEKAKEGQHTDDSGIQEEEADDDDENWTDIDDDE